MAIVVPIVSEWNPKGVQRATADINRAQGGWAKAGAGFRAAFAPAAAALGGLAVAGGFAVKQASDLAESANAVEKTFGASSATIEAFGKTSAKAAGLAQSEFQQMATATGAMLTNLGYSQDQAAKSTVDLTQRAADMASVMNTSVPEALEAINAGLRGESEPLRKYGVGLNDAALKAEALALGLYKGKGPLKDTAKIRAAESLIMKQTAKYAGDYADTADGLANSQRSLSAQAKDLGASLGTALLPAMETFMGLAATFAAWASTHQGTVKALAVAIAVLATAVILVNAAMSAWAAGVAVFTLIQPIIAAVKAWTVVQWLLNASMWGFPLVWIIAGLAAIVLGIVLLWKKSQTFRTIVTGAFSAVWGAIKAVWNWVKTNWPLLLAILTGPIGIAVLLITKNWQKIKDAIGAVVDWIKRTWDTALDPVTDAFQAVWEFIQRIIGNIRSAWDSVSGIIGNLNPFAAGVQVNQSTAGIATMGTRAASSSSSGPVNITIQGALDPEATARQVRRLLDDHSFRQGRYGRPRAVAW